jgi:hypothetical protein
MPPRPPEVQQLLVEGNDDRHVIWQLCEQHRVPETFAVTLPGGDPDGRLGPSTAQGSTPPRHGEPGGIGELLKDIPVRLRQPGLRTLGIVVDADEDVAGRWRQLRALLSGTGYDSVPADPPGDGWVLVPGNAPRVGVWLMPNNQIAGAVEDFARSLIPQDDTLLPKAEAALGDIEGAGLRRYRPAHRPKALIHTWLAWQENPGYPMGTAIKAGSLRYDAPLALAFVAWLRRLFDP